MIKKLAISLTPSCNYKCSYCNVYGEDIGCGIELSTEEILNIIRVAYDFGIKIIRFTGGEPTLRRDFFEIIKKTRNISDDIKILIDTNGSSLSELVNFLNEIKNIELRVGIDSFKKLEGFYKIYNEKLGEELKEIGNNCTPIRINMVVTKENADQVLKMIDFCVKNNYDLKLLDLEYKKRYKDNNYTWKDHYYDLRNLMSSIRKLSTHETKGFEFGAKGVLLHKFKIKNSLVIIKNSKEGAYYNNKCSHCPNYPCQEGLYTPFVSSNGLLSPSNCSYFKWNLYEKSDDEIKQAFKEILNLLDESRFLKNSFVNMIKSD